MKATSSKPATLIFRPFHVALAFANRLIFIALAAALAPALTSGHAATFRAQSNVPVEITFEAAAPFAEADSLHIDAVFTTPSGQTLRVPAFWAGGKLWKARYASPQRGRHTFRTECPTAPSSGLHGVEGVVDIAAYDGGNPLFCHGPLRVSKDRRHFEHADGTPFFWLGDTWWMGLSKRLDWPAGFQSLAADRKEKGFTVIQIVGGLPPDMPPLDERGAGDGGQAWTEDFSRVRPEFFNAADLRIRHLVEQGLTPCIVAAWKDYLPILGPDKMKRHWRNLVARYAAYPVVWIVGGEINQTRANPRFLGNFKPVMETNATAFRAGWTEVTRHLHEIDPFDRIVGAHNQNDYHVLDDPALLDMYFLQSGHSGLGSISAQTEWFADLSRAAHRAPLVMSEGNYQWLFNDGSFDDQLQRHQFWAVMLDGGAGHTYGANGVWQVNLPDKPFGPSPHGFVWGNTPWPEAMRHAASRQLGLGRKILESLPWTELSPASSLVRFTGLDLPPIARTAARWIEIPGGMQRTRLVGATFEIPGDAAIRSATLRLACDVPSGLSLNGAFVHRHAKLDFHPRHQHADAWLFPLAGEYLKPGRNILQLRFDAAEFPNTVELLAHLRIELEDGKIHDVVSNEDWRWTVPETGWPGYTLKTDPADWNDRMKASDRQPDPASLDFREIETYGPRCAALPGKIWLIYNPAAVPLEMSGLPANAEFTLEQINPRTGERRQTGTIRSDAFGRWRHQPPNTLGDQVILLRAAE